jgi:hypothetical protein
MDTQFNHQGGRKRITHEASPGFNPTNEIDGKNGERQKLPLLGI